MNLNNFTPNAPQVNASIPLPIIETPEGAQGQRRGSLGLPLNITGIIQSPFDMQTNSTARTQAALNANDQTSNQRPGGTSSTTLQPSEPPPRRHVTSSAHFSREMAASYPPPVAPTTSFLANWSPAPSKPPKTKNKPKPHNEGGNNAQKQAKKEANRKAARRAEKEETRSQKGLKHQDSGRASQAGPSASSGSGLRFSARQGLGSTPRQGLSGATQAPSSAARPSSSSPSASAISPSSSSSPSPQAAAQTQAPASAPAPTQASAPAQAQAQASASASASASAQASAPASAQASTPTPAAPTRELGARAKIRSGSSASPQSSASSPSSLSAQSPQSPQSQSSRLTPPPPNLQEVLRAERHEGRARRNAQAAGGATEVQHAEQPQIPKGSVVCGAQTNGQTGDNEKVTGYDYFKGEFPDTETVLFDEAKAKCDSMTEKGGDACKAQTEELCKGLFSRVNTKDKEECEKVKDYKGNNGNNLNDWQKNLDCTKAKEGAGAGAAGSAQGGAGNSEGSNVVSTSPTPANVKHDPQPKVASSSLVCGTENNGESGDQRRVTGYRTLKVNLPTKQFVTAEEAQAAINAIFAEPDQAYCSAQTDLLAEQWTARVDTRNTEECKKLKNLSQGQNSWQGNLDCNPSTAAAPAEPAAPAAPEAAVPDAPVQTTTTSTTTSTTTTTTMSPSGLPKNWKAAFDYVLSVSASVLGLAGSVFALWTQFRSCTKPKEEDAEKGDNGTSGTNSTSSQNNSAKGKKPNKKVTKGSLDEVQPLDPNGNQNGAGPKKPDDKSDGSGGSSGTGSGSGSGSGSVQHESAV